MHHGVHAVRRHHLLPALLLVALACDDPARPPSPALAEPASITGTHQLSVDVLESDWDTYSADITIATEDPSAPGYVPGATTLMQYSVSKSLGSGNVWTTIDSMTTPKRFVASGPEPYLGRLVHVDDGVTPQKFYDASGAEVVLPPPRTQPLNHPGDLPAAMIPPGADAPPPQISGGSGSLMADPAAGMPARGTVPGARGEPRAWLDAIVLTTAGRERARKARRDKFGAPSGQVNGRERFVVRGRSGAVMEMLVDTALGAVIEKNVAVNGQLESHVTYEYERVAPGVHLRRRMRVEHRDASRPNGRSTISVTLVNVKVSRRAGGAR